jgi:thioredoxin-dependent peroxiredoxin
MLKPGEIAPDFTLQDQTAAPRTLDSLLEGGRLVLYFYPADFSPVCTKQACTIRDEHSRLISDGTRIAGVSTGSMATHAKFAKAFGLPFPVLSDPDKSVCRAYGALGPLGLWTNRVSYVIGPDRRVVDAVSSGLLLGRHWKLMGIR